MNDKKILRLNPMTRNSRVLKYKIILVGLLVFRPLVLALPAARPANESGILRGRVVDHKHEPIAGAVITLVDDDRNLKPSATSDQKGAFVLAGIPAGDYSLFVEAPGFEPQAQKDVRIEPFGDLYFLFRMQPAGPSDSQSGGPDKIDGSPLSTRTTIFRSQIERLPSANSVWSLVENQDFSATTNRIDIGGLWETSPALFSARGGSSWTQNSYLLNGLDVSDPYWTGLPLFIPDYFSLECIQMSNAAHPVQALHPGGAFVLVPREGTPDFRGGFSGYYSDKNMTSSNITPLLVNEGMTESHSIDKLSDFNLHLSGPLGRPELQFFVSVTTQSISRNIADYDRENQSRLFSGLLNVRYQTPRSTLKLLWTGQGVTNPAEGAARRIPFVSTTRQYQSSDVVQLLLDSNPRQGRSYSLGLSLARVGRDKEFQKGAAGPYKLQIFQNIPSGSAPEAGRDSRSHLTLFAEGKSFFTNGLKADHLLQYGIQAQYSSASSRMDVGENKHLYFYDGRPIEVAFFNTPLEHRESAVQVNAFAQDTITLPGLFSVSLGLNAGWSYGRNRMTHILWFHFSPRLGLNFPLSSHKTSFVRISTARYYFTLPLNYLSYGNPDAPGRLVYAWNDENGDLNYQDDERGVLLRREGPLYSGIDPNIKRPFTDEFTVSLIHDFGSGWFFTLAGFLRETRNLVETINTGVLPGDYRPVSFYDEGDDRFPGTPDDLILMVYDQNEETLGHDFYLLTNPDASSRISKYQGMDLTLIKKYSQKFLFFLAFTATYAVATTSPGNSEWENDDGVIGLLYDNPNAAINARGRPHFDRAYTGRIGIGFPAPFGTRLGAIVKYYDGQPFARKIIVMGLNQGPFYIQAHPRGVSRYEYNMTVDVRLEKEFKWNKGTLRIIIDGFNIFNRNLATAENEWTGPEFPLRFATEIQSPRVFRIGLNYEF